MFLALSYYAIWARHWFKGPRVNIEYTHENTEILEGQVPANDGIKQE